MSLGTQIDEGLFDLLTATSAITDLLAAGTASVFAELAPQNAEHPLVVFERVSEVPVWQLDSLSYESVIYNVRAIATNESIAVAGSVDAEIRTVLDDGSITVADHTLMLSRREGGVSFVEVVDGQRYNHRGAMYRIWLAPD